MSRGKEVRDPAVAIAMARCWLASWSSRSLIGLDINEFHPDNCGFCEIPRETIMEMLEEFADWSNISSYDESVPLRAEIEAWETLPREEQKTMVERAAGWLERPKDQRSPW